VGLQFDNGWALLLLLPCAFVMWRAIKGTIRLTGWRKMAAITIRSLILVLLVAVVAGATRYQTAEQRNIVFVADRSESLNEEAAINEWVRAAINGKTDEDRAALISFGLNAAVERTLSQDDASTVALRTTVNRAFSNIAGALQLAAGLLPDGGRIVLLSDGEENAGDMLRQGRRLKEMGIPVDVVPIPKRLISDAAVTSLRVPASMKQGEKFAFEIAVASTMAGTAELRLFEDDVEKASVAIPLEAGENRFALHSIAELPGIHRYRAELYLPGDQQARNNTAYAFSRIEGAPRVLIVEGATGSSGNIASALEASLIPYDIVIPEQLPVELADYARYDSIILNNVPATRIAEAPMRNLSTVVSDYGIGLVMVGGKDSYGLGGYYKTPVEKALPVYMDLQGKRQLPSLGLILIIDKSGSMDGGKLELAKEAALRTVELLRDEDTVGVVAFDNSPWWVVEPVKLDKREEVMQAIRGIQPSGGTEIYTAVQTGLDRLLRVEAQRKHLILLTDGQSATYSDYSNLTSTMVDNDITMSTVAVGSGADTILLERLAQEANGRYYFTNDQSTIPAIFSRETTIMSRTYIVENRFVPSVGMAGNWRPLFADGIPAVNAYVATTAKETAETVLLTPMGDPLLARWQFGSGRTVAWTSDLTGQWAQDWIGWSKFPDLFAQWVKWTFPQFSGEPYEISAGWDGGGQAELQIRETSGQGTGAAGLQVVVTGEKGDRFEVSPIPVEPGTYQASMPITAPGVYLTQIGGSVSGFVIPYSPEYQLPDGSGQDKLARLAELTGGRMLDPEQPEAVFAVAPTKTKQYEDLTRPLLILILLLWLVDIAIRRISVPWGKGFAWLRRIVRKQQPVADGAPVLTYLERLQQRKKQTGAFYAGEGTQKAAEGMRQAGQGISGQSAASHAEPGASSPVAQRPGMETSASNVQRQDKPNVAAASSVARSGAQPPSVAQSGSQVSESDREAGIGRLLEAKKRRLR